MRASVWLGWVVVAVVGCSPDADGDGFHAGVDCDDADPAVNPDATEVCNGIDDDCDGLVDPPSSEGTMIVHPDRDGDGFGDAHQTNKACELPLGWTTDGTDCDDSDANVHTGC